MKYILAIITMFMIIGINASAQEVPEWVTPIGACQDNFTLYLYANWTFDNNGSMEVYNVDLGQITCPYGCVVNATQYGDDCANRPINDASFVLVIWLIGVAFAIGAWRQKYWWGAWTGSTLMLALSLWFMWYTSLVIGMIPFAVAIMMIFEAVSDSTRKKR